MIAGRVELRWFISFILFIIYHLNTLKEGAANMQRYVPLQMDHKQCVLTAFLLMLNIVPFHFLLSDSWPQICNVISIGICCVAFLSDVSVSPAFIAMIKNP